MAWFLISNQQIVFNSEYILIYVLLFVELFFTLIGPKFDFSLCVLYCVPKFYLLFCFCISDSYQCCDSIVLFIH